VRVRGDRWRVLRVAPYGECAVAELAGAGDANRGRVARFILPFEVIESFPAPSAVPRRVRRVVFRAVARRLLAAATPAWTSLRAAARARVVLLPYQLEPAIAMLRGMSCRLLLADSVGLGKTIQAGLLIAELLARDPDARILIVTPAGLREQWREELRDRFDVEAEVLDAAALTRATAMLPADVNPWAVPRVILASIDFVKRPDVIRSLESIVWDLVAFDEAHGLAGRSDRATAAELLARRGRRVLAITATPHSGDSAAYERLLTLGRLSADDSILIFRRSREDAGIALRRVTRILRVRPTEAERALNRALDDYARRVFREAPADSAPGARLAMMVLARRAASSAASLARSVERRMALLDPQNDQHALQLVLPLADGTLRDDEEPDSELAARGLADGAVEMRWLQRVVALANIAAASESKITALERILRRADEPVIVFTEYRDTLERLVRVLAPGIGNACAADREGLLHSGRLATLHGGMTTAQRAREARRFTHGDARILLATDAASEGLNLQRRCRLVVNLEVPWTPLRLEQRIGRVDRLGQEHRVHAIGLVGRDTAEESVVGALMARTATADREAPFGGANLRAEACAEAARLATARTLGAGTRAEVQIPARSRDRPVVASFNSGRTQIVTAFHLSFVDAAGIDLWETLVGACTMLGHVIAPATGQLIVTANALSGPAISELHETLRRRLASELRTAIGPLIAREGAMLGSLQARRGRLAAPLVQPGLFDRRAMRDAEAQQRLVEAAAAESAMRVAALERMLDPEVGGQRVMFAVV
jgi:ERCC4-related helicase